MLRVYTCLGLTDPPAAAQRADNGQRTAVNGQQSADSRQQSADSSQRTADSGLTTGSSKVISVGLLLCLVCVPLELQRVIDSYAIIVVRVRACVCDL